MTAPYEYSLKRDLNGRIVEKIETVAGRAMVWTYDYDKAGRLTEARLDGRQVCQCWYDREGRRIQDCFPRSVGRDLRRFSYRLDNRLQSAGNNGYTHDGNGFRSIWNNGGRYTTYAYAPDYRLLRAEKEDEGTVFEFAHDDEGRRVAKYCNGGLTEAYAWRDFIRLAGFHDGEQAFEFAYVEDERTPYAMRREDGFIAYLFCDQVGSLRVVADMDGNVIKEILYDPFGGIIEDTNPALRIPIGFAGGLHDRDLGFVRFGWRDYDPFTSRWTAPDPMGDAGGDDDWYGYCLDDPVNTYDPRGLKGETVDGVTYDENGMPIDEKGLADPDIDPVMDLIPVLPIGKAITKAGKGTYRIYKAGKEFKFGKNWRIAPLGNRTGKKVGELPHYHRRGIDLKTGKTKEGQGIGRHRPWEIKKTDKSYKDRF
ncbi:RHS repeat domain-containing protein [Pseudodesulfovibrio cashew]|uniref:RHS repeat domain-containing protein n=1 Tax=Pseudodesulfovibrio cashew TaxID=2678688 RepID=UPI0018EF2AFF|nr:RHS repeat-associated core domain-containing protein [Pseudodesulfovibrio cashew]